jgi:acetyl-CoA carboxylase biotin carboxyl carrier protein
MAAPEEQGKPANRRARPRREQSNPAPSMNMDEVRELIALMRDNGLTELEIEGEEFRVRLRRDSVPSGSAPHAAVPVPTPVPEAAPALAPTQPAPQAPAEPTSPEQDLHIIPSPIVGTFYRSPSPSADPFVKIGSNVEHETVVCIIEAMKLMNEIQAEATGEVVKIYVENGQPVEYGQPLFGIRS